jgi:N-acetylglucosaminyl-diphospho-decaprenol L-rhamnosyltransferase
LHDLAVIIISTNEAEWLRPALRSVFEHRGDALLDVVVADNESTDGTRELVEREFPEARIVQCRNRGFAHANNRALMTCDARYALFLNPDTEILHGTFGDLVKALDERPRVGLVGVRQLAQSGRVYPTIRRFPNALRAFGEALGAERLPFRARWLRERELDLSLYDREVVCDWVSGSFMLARREALESAGYMDERSFIYTEEPDLCLRMKRDGWEVRYVPYMTIFHNWEKATISARMGAQAAVAWRHYARKHFSRAHQVAFEAALWTRYGLRAVVARGDLEQRRQKRAAARRALRVMAGLEDPPFGLAPLVAVAARDGGPGGGVNESTVR